MMASEVFLGVITAAIVAFVIFSIWAIIRLVAALNSTNLLLTTTDRSMQEVMTELARSLAALRVVIENLNAVADDLRLFSGAVREVGEGVRAMAGSVKRVGDTMQIAGNEAISSVRGIRAGVKAGFEVLLKNLFQVGAG